jgi:hypothetical protein
MAYRYDTLLPQDITNLPLLSYMAIFIFTFSFFFFFFLFFFKKNPKTR